MTKMITHHQPDTPAASRCGKMFVTPETSKAVMLSFSLKH